MRRFRIALLSVCALAAWAAGAAGATTKIWVSDTASDFSAGEARGVAVGMDGTLILSRQARRVDGVSEASLFATATDKAGNAYLATGDSGRILRVPVNGKPEVIATLKEKEVTALAVGPDGVVYAGGSPGGTVYRIEKGAAAPLYETHARYVWALAISGGNLYAGTGIPGQIFRITLPKGAAKGEAAGERIHTTADSHVRTLCVDSRGRIWAGTSGSGLVLRIEPTGAVSTVYDSSKGEVTSIVAGRDGRMWAAAGSSDVSPASGELVSAPREAPTAKAVKPQADGGGGGEPRAEVTVSVSAPRIAPQTTTGTRGGYSSEVVLFDDGEPGRSVWTSNQELVFALEPDGDGSGVLAATGPNGKLYRLGVGRASLERTFDEKQVSTLSADLVGTNAATGVYRLAGGARDGEYVSAVKDTGRTSRFGAFRWEGEVPAGTKLEFAFRSGESATPDTTWSPWSAYAASKRADVVSAPGGRYLQYKVRMSSDGAALPVIRRIEAAYRNRNGAPVVDSLIALGPNEVYARSASGGSNVFESTTPDEKGIFTTLEESRSEGTPRRLMRKGYRTLTWKATDPDADTLSYDLEFRPVGASRWLPLRKNLKETFYSFDSTSLPDGEYLFRVTASDAEANPDEKKIGSRESSPTQIDNTPPVIRKVGSGGGTAFEFEAADAASPILEAEYSVDAKEWIRVEPKDGLSDSPTESYSIPLSGAPRGGFLLIRVMDAARNVAAASFPLP
jgi:two component regulator with propeller domain